MASPFSLENALRRHDEAVYEWLGGLVVDYGLIAGVARNQVPILRVLSTPDRAWAALHNQLVAQNWIEGSTAEQKLTNAEVNFDVLPLPFASIEPVPPLPYPEGSGVPKRFRRQRYDGGELKWEEHPWPGSWRTEYRVTLWSAKRYTLVWMREWMKMQLGQLGAAEIEVFIPVVHAEPWGTLRQALRFEAASDLSNLEGEDPRYLRDEITFTLNTLLFRPPTAQNEDLNTIVVGAVLTAGVNTLIQDLGDLTGVDLAPVVLSGNLYQPYFTPPLTPTLWPKAGGAVVSHSSVTPDGKPDAGALKVEVELAADQVDLTNRPLALDVDGLALLSYRFQYLSDAAVDLDLQQHDGSDMAVPMWTRVDLQTLPASAAWSRVHGFSLVSQPIVDLALIGSGVPATLRIAKLLVQHVHSGVKVAPTSTTLVGSENRHVWTGLAIGAYLLAVAFTSAVGSGTVTAENDDTTPTYSKTDVIDTSAQRSAVFLIQPAATSLVVRVPTALTIAAVYLQRYDAGYGGNDA